jgi:hypothetical protein
MHIAKGQRYRHFKGDEYVVLGVGTHTETLESMVIYTLVDVPSRKTWVRPLSLFRSTALDGGKEVQRFTLLPSLGESIAAV